MASSSGSPLLSFQQQLRAVGLDTGEIIDPSSSNSSVSKRNPFKLPRSRFSTQAVFFDSLLSKKPQDETQLHKFQSLPIEQQISQFCENEKLSKKQLSIRFQIAFDIMTLLRKNGYPNCVVYLFGSLLTGVADQDSDIDIFIDINGDDGQSLQKLTETGSDLEKMAELKKIQQKIYDITRSSACPHSNSSTIQFSNNVKCFGIHILFVRMVHFQTKIQGDLTFTSILSLQNSRLQLFYLSKFHPEILKPFILILRRWAKYHAITGGRDLKNFALMLLALTFLMEMHVIPSVELLQKLTPALKIDGWNGAFCEDMSLINQHFNRSSSEVTILELLSGFFKWVGKTDFEKCVISPFLGKVVDKAPFVEEQKLGESFDDVVIIPPRGRFTEEHRISRVLFIQDPFCQDYNVGVSTSTVAMEKLKEASNKTVNLYPWKSFTDLFVAMAMTPLEMEKKKRETEDANGALLAREISKAMFGNLDLSPLSENRFMVSAFSLDYNFKHTYLKELAQCDISVNDEKAMIGVTKLWKSFGEGFLKECLHNSLKLQVARFEEQRKDISSIGGGWHMEMLTNAQIQRFQMDKHRIHPFHIENLKEKIGKLINLEPDKVVNNEIVYQVWGIQVNYPFWSGEQEESGHEKRQPTRRGRGGRGRGRRGTPNQISQSSQNYFSQGNPIDVQAKVCENILRDFDKHTFEPFEITMFVKLDARIVSEDCVIRPALNILVELPGINQSVEEHRNKAVEYLAKVLQSAFPAYQVYHLTQWIKSRA